MFDVNKVEIARKPGKKQKENPARCDGEGEHSEGNIGCCCDDIQGKNGKEAREETEGKSSRMRWRS